MRASSDSRESTLSSFAKGSLQNSAFHILYNIMRMLLPLLEFRLHELAFGSRFYILLPKLNRAQMKALGTRLKTQGFTLGGDTSIIARKDGVVLHVDPHGLCWSRSNPADSVVPVIPELLGMTKEAVPLEELKRRYFFLEHSGPGATLRFEPRLERGSSWKALRATNQCGLAPDEGAVLLFLLGFAMGTCDMLTDFPIPTSRERIIGGRQYFDSPLPCTEIRPTLRLAGARSPRNSYLPSKGTIQFGRLNPPSRRVYVELFEDLGEWCYLMPE